MSFFLEILARVGKVKIAYKGLDCSPSEKDVQFYLADKTEDEKCKSKLTVELPYRVKNWSHKVESSEGMFQRDTSQYTLKDEKDESLKTTCFLMKCFKCEQVVINNYEFENVFPLPSSNWREWGDLWWCHNKDKDTVLQKFQTSEIPARLHSLLVDKLYFLIHENDLYEGSVQYTSSSDTIELNSNQLDVLCSHCDTSLGTIDKETDSVKLFRSNLAWIDSTSPPPSMIHTMLPETVFANILMDKCKDETCYRFWIKDHANHSHFQIWILSLESQIAAYRPTNVHQISSRGEANIKIRNVIKVLYNVCESFEVESDHVEQIKTKYGSAWVPGRFTNQELVFPEQFCKMFIKQLETSNLSILPVEVRKLNGFHAGFLVKGR